MATPSRETSSFMTRFCRRRRLLALAGLTAGIVVGAWFLWDRLAPAPVPPTVNTSGIDPEAAQAITDALAAVRSHPRALQAWSDLALTLFAHDFYAESVECFVQAARLDPNDMRWPYFEGLARWDADKAAAIAPLQRAAALAERDPVPQVRVAEALLEEGRTDEAVGYLQRALKLDPGNPRALVNMGTILFRQGDARGSLPYLEAAGEHVTTQKAAVTLLAQVYEKLGESPRAAAARTRATSLPDDVRWYDPILEKERSYQKGPLARIRTAGFLLDGNQVGEAIALLQDTVQRYPNSDQAHLSLGKAYLRMGQHHEAETALREALRLKPDLYQAIFLLGAAVYGQKDYSRAAEQFRRALEANPEDPLAQFNLGLCRLELKDPAGAIAAWKGALRVRPDSAEIHFRLGELLIREGQAQEGVAHLEDAVRLAPQNAQFKQRLDESKARHLSTGK